MTKWYANWPVQYNSATLSEVEKVCRFARLFKIEIEDWQKPIIAEFASGRKEIIVLLPKGNGKTALGGVLMLWHLLRHSEPEGYVGAASKDQSKILWRNVSKFARRNPEIEKYLDIKWDIIRVKKGEGFLKALPADVPKQHGIAPTLCFLDELWAQKTADQYSNFRESIDKAGGQMITISTAGDDINGPLGKLRDNCLTYPRKEVFDKLTFAWDDEASVSFFEWALAPGDDFTDSEVVKRANPLSTITPLAISQIRSSPGNPEPLFKQFRCNLWIDAQDMWLPEGSWEACKDVDASIPEGEEVWLGVDIGYITDSSAVVKLWPRPDGKTIVEADIWTPKGDGTELDLSLIDTRIREIGQQNVIRGITYDPALFIGNAQQLLQEGYPMIKYPQTDGRMMAASSGIYEAIIAGDIVHNGDPELTAHVGAAAFMVKGGGFKLVKGKAKRPIDAAIAMTIGYTQVKTGVNPYRERGFQFIELA